MYRILLIILLATGLGFTVHASGETGPETSKKERNLVKEGNKYYNDTTLTPEKRFGKAVECYQKALRLAPDNNITKYNLATATYRLAMLQKGRSGLTDKAQATIMQTINNVDSIYNEIFDMTADRSLKERIAYNRGNIAYNNENYQASIESYKDALRLNPGNNNARQNLRLAQLKLQQQQNDKNDQNNKEQDKKNQDNNDKNNQDQQNKDQNKQNQQDQQNQQNKDNKDQEKQDQQQPNQPNQQNQDRKDNRQDQQTISDQNAQQILKAMENAESATRRRVDKAKARKEEREAGRRVIEKPW